MKRMLKSLVAVALAMGLTAVLATVTGCEITPEPAPAKPASPVGEAPVKTDAAKAAAKPLMDEYAEIPVGQRLVVVGSKESAEKVKASGKPGSYVAEIGYGPNGQTVYFENKPDGMEAALKAEFAKRHAAK